MKKTRLEKIVFGIVFGIFVLYAIYLLFPFGFCLHLSLKADPTAYTDYKMALSIPPNFNNFLQAITNLEVNETGFIMMVINSIWYSFGSTFFTIFSSAMAAYVVARYKFFGRNFLYVLALVVMIIPIYGALPAQYKLYTDIGITDSPLLLIATPFGFGFNFLILYSFFSALSWSYAEAAFIDGANDFTVFFRIMIPMAMPSITAVAIMAVVTEWNNYETPILYLPNMPTLAGGLWAYETKMEYGGSYPIYYAGMLISMVPILIIFGIFQNTIMSNVYAGGLKG